MARTAVRKRRILAVAQSATPAINTDAADMFQITGLAQAITSMTSGLTGTPAAGDIMEIQLTDSGTGRALTWGNSFASTTVALPSTTVASTMLKVVLERNAGGTWDCVGVA